MNLLSRSTRRMMKMVMLALLGFQFTPPAMASVREGDFTLRTPVSEAVLDSMRGGFQRDSDGPFMSFGIERNVFDNGKLVSFTVLKIPDMARFADRNWSPFADHSNMKPVAGHSSAKPFAGHGHTDTRPVVHPRSDTFALIQSGPGNSLPSDLSALPPFMTVIQNSLDNRAIRTETVIDVTVEALTWARSLQLGNALSLANVEAIRH